MKQDSNVIKQKIAQMLAIDLNNKKTNVENKGEVKNGDLIFQKFIVRKKDEIPLPVLRLNSSKQNPGKIIIWLNEKGKDEIADSASLMHSYLDKNYTVLLCDVSGTGETTDNPQFNDKKYYNKEYRNAMPYERKVVMSQGNTSINGPHQGAWVTTQTGENWFLHFQDKGIYGRVIHLEPMKWMNNWPVIGIDKNGNGTGEPVSTYKKPNVGKKFAITTPVESDEFNSNALGLQWQWMANPQPTWYFLDPSKGLLRLFSAKMPDSANNLWDAPNVLLQKFPAEEFTATVKMNFHRNEKLQNEKAGLAIMGLSYADIKLVSKPDGII